jgi:hypothetical protein
MNEVLKAQNDVTVFANGDVTISQRKLANLLGVNENTMLKYIRSTHSNYMKSNGLDAFLVASSTHYFATKAKTRTQQAIDLSAKFMEAGAKAFLYHEAGYKFEAKQNNFAQQELEKAQAKLAYCSIDDNCPKAVFKLRDHKKVRLVYNDWVGIGWLVERKRMVEQVDYLLTTDGSERLEFKSGKIHVKADMHHETRLITHGARLALHGQSDVFIDLQAA